MPRLYGAPASHRRRHVDVQRPFDPDDLPLEAHRSFADHALLGDRPMTPVVDEQPDELEQGSFLRRAILPFGARSHRPSGTRR